MCIYTKLLTLCSVHREPGDGEVPASGALPRALPRLHRPVGLHATLQQSEEVALRAVPPIGPGEFVGLTTQHQQRGLSPSCSR